MNLKEEIQERLKNSRPTRCFSYIHGNGRIGVLLELESDTDFALKTEEVEELAHNLCLQIASMAPLYIEHLDVLPHIITGKEEKYTKEAIEEGKPENIAKTIATGKLRKWFQEVCLMEQTFVKNPSQDIDSLFTEVSKQIKEDLTIINFARFGK